jgi:hypothetical protein
MRMSVLVRMELATAGRATSGPGGGRPSPFAIGGPGDRGPRGRRAGRRATAGLAIGRPGKRAIGDRRPAWQEGDRRPALASGQLRNSESQTCEAVPNNDDRAFDRGTDVPGRAGCRRITPDVGGALGDATPENPCKAAKPKIGSVVSVGFDPPYLHRQPPRFWNSSEIIDIFATLRRAFSDFSGPGRAPMRPRRMTGPSF